MVLKRLHCSGCFGFYLVLLVFILTDIGTLTGASEAKLISAHVGDSVSLPCHVDRKQCGSLHSVKWYKDTSRIYVLSHAGSVTRAEGDATNRLNVTYNPSDVEALLKIAPVKIDDEATYKCEITYLEVRESCDVVQIVKLKTLIKPKSTRILNSKQEELKDNSVLGPHLEGDEIDLICEAAEGKPVPKVKWFNGTNEIGRAEYTADTNDTGIGTGRSKLQLTLSRGDLNAKFECRVESEALDQPIMTSVTADVHVRPTRMELTGVKSHVVQGTNVLLICDVFGARPAAAVRWMNGTQPIVNDGMVESSPEDNLTPRIEPSKLFQERDGTFTTRSELRFQASHWENGIKIHCYAENEVMKRHYEPEMHKVLILEVRYPPVINVQPKNITVNESDVASLSNVNTGNGGLLLICNYKANPQELKAAFWSKDDTNLTLTDVSKYTGGTIENPPLIIYNVTRDDMGSYTCWLKNEAGLARSEDSIFLNVQYKPEVEVVMKPSMPVKAVDKGEVLLECNVTTGNPSNLTKVRWFLDNELMKEFPECNYTAENDVDGGPFCGLDPTILSLERVDESFAGNYTCQGESEAGWGPISEAQELIVYYPPTPAKLRYYPSTVIKEGSVVLECRVDSPGRPDNITYIWYRGSHQMTEITTASFNITPVRLETRSNFTCIAQNEGGQSDPATAFINVNAPPTFILKLPTYQGFLYSAKYVNLTCRVECSPMCDIIWKKDGHTLNLDNNPKYYNVTKIYPPDLQKYDFESIESTLVWNLTSWPGQKLDISAPNSIYTCQSSSNAVGKGVTSDIEIAVDFPPQDLTVSPKQVNVNENHVPSPVRCQGRGNPKLTYIWKRNNTIYEGEELRLKQLNRSDSGAYTCVAKNKHGVDSETVYINVQYPPKCSLSRTEKDGNPALLCTVEANPQSVSFTWKVKESNDTFIETSNIIQDTLRSYLILDGTVDIPRTYYCLANNSVGTTKEICEIDILGVLPWWKRLDQEKLIIIIAPIIAIIICMIIICLIIILCRRKRSGSKSLNQSSTGDKIHLGQMPPYSSDIPLTKDPSNMDNDRGFYENLPFHGMQNPPNKPYKPDPCDMVYADVDYMSNYGPINYKAASIYAAMKKNKNSRLEEVDNQDVL